MKYRKQYINVDVVFDASGRMRPQVIHWVDGRRYEISRVKAIVPAASRKSGGQGDRYTVMLEVRSATCFLSVRQTNALPSSGAGL